MTQTEIAKKLAVSPQRLSDWFSGRHTPKPATAERISKMTGIDIHVLLFGTGEMLRRVLTRWAQKQNR